MKRSLAILLSACLVFLCCSCEEKGSDSSNKTIRFHLSAEPQTLDPQIADDYPAVVAVEALYEGLVRLDAENQPYPGVAESWTSNADFTEFTFRLRSDAKWSNGDPVTADDFVFALRRALSPATNSKTCEPLYCIQNAQEVRAGSSAVDSLGVTAKDSRTLVIRLEYPYEAFPALTAITPFMPCQQKFFEETSGKYGLEVNSVLGNGPFKIRNRYGWEHGKHLELSRSSTYSGENSPSPASLIFSIGSAEADVSDIIKALDDSVVDAVELPASLLVEADSKGFPIQAFQDTTWGLVFNTSQLYHEEPNIMRDASVRRAFLQTLDREKLTAFVPENSSPAQDIITPGTTYLGKKYRELAGSGMLLPQDDASVYQVPDALNAMGYSEIPVVTVLCPDDEKIKLMVNEMLATWNQKLGSYFNMEPLPFSDLQKRVASGNYQIALYRLRPNGDGPMQLLSFFSSSSSSNPAFLSDPAYDAMLDQAKTLGGMEAMDFYRQAEAYLNEQGIFYPLYYESRYYACGKDVTGIVFHPYQGGVDFIAAGKGKPKEN